LNKFEDTEEELIGAEENKNYSKTMSNFHKPLLNTSGNDGNTTGDDVEGSPDKGKGYDNDL
jgi:hypothetical protein